MTLSSGEIYQPAFTQNHNSIARGFEFVLFNERSDTYHPVRHFAKRDEIKLEIKVATVADDRAISHACEMLPIDHMSIAGYCYEDMSK